MNSTVVGIVDLSDSELSAVDRSVCTLMSGLFYIEVKIILVQPNNLILTRTVL